MLAKKNTKKEKTKNTIQQQTLYIDFKTKNENMTKHIMSYVVDTAHYDYIKNTVHFECL